MNYLKTGLALSTILMFMSVIFLQYEVFGAKTISAVFIMPAVVINASLLYKVFKKPN